MHDDKPKGDEEIASYPAKICEVIAKYVDNPLELSTFATGGEIDPFTLGIPAVIVKNVGRVAYPLCVEQSESLLKVATQAPFGHGTQTVLDVSVRKAWQIDSDLVVINQHWLNNSLPKIVTDCCTKLGVDAVKLGVRANLYKMLLYTEGGHFKRHKDTEKEHGMFGSLLIQLPADHEGGSLVVEHGGQSKCFEFAKDSADKAFYSSFYADCDHVLEPVTKGMRLVLAFNLVRGVESTEMSSAASILSHRKGFEEALVSAASEWLEDDYCVEKYVYPLTYKYTQTNISFAGLKGTDQKALSLLRSVADPVTNERLFSVYLALVTKHVTGTDEDNGMEYYNRKRSSYGDDYGERRTSGGVMSSDGDIETQFKTVSWVGPNGAIDFGSLTIDFSTEVITANEPDSDADSTEQLNEICADIFGDKPDKEVSEGYMGNYAGSLEFWYNSAVLVFWPAVRDFDIKLSANPKEAIAVLHSMDSTTEIYLERLTKLLDYLLQHSAIKWNVRDLLPLTLNVAQVRTILNMSYKHVFGEDDCRAVVLAVSQYGLAALSTEFSAILEAQSLKMSTFLLQLVEAQSLAPLSDDSTVCSSSAVTVSFSDLVDKLVEKIVTSSCADADVDLEYVSNFIVAHCDIDTQMEIAEHFGKTLKLKAINHLIKTVLVVANGEFIEQLQQYAVLQSVRNEQTPIDISDVVDWVVHGQHNDLMDTLTPKIISLCNATELFRALFAVPLVVAELKNESHICTLLESIAHARINILSRAVATHSITWCMPNAKNITSDPRVGPFLAGPEQSIQLQGHFNDLRHARNWAQKYFNSYSGIQHVTAAPSGAGGRAMVTLSKQKSYQDAVVQNRTNNVNEMNNLNRLLKVRSVPHNHAPLAVVTGLNASVVATPSTAGSEQKKQKVEREVIEID